MFCPGCGNQIENYVVICPKCGYRNGSAGVNGNQQVYQNQGMPNQGFQNPGYQMPGYPGGMYQAPEPPKKNTGVIIAVAILIALIVIAVVAGVFFIYPTFKAESKAKTEQDDDDDDEDEDDDDDDDDDEYDVDNKKHDDDDDEYDVDDDDYDDYDVDTDDYDDYDVDTDDTDISSGASNNAANYDLIVPDGYSLEQSEDGVFLYANSKGNSIVIVLVENTRKISIEEIVEDSDYYFDSAFEIMELDLSTKSKISDSGTVTSGDFSGKIRKYNYADKGLRGIMILANNTDVAFVYMFGMDDIDAAVLGTDILRK